MKKLNLSKLNERKNKDNSNNMSDCIFYKIVDEVFPREKYCYQLQYVNTVTFFDSKISDIVFDNDILMGLHPIQASFIGMEYAKFRESNPSSEQNELNNNHYMVTRYGNNQLRGFDRENNVYFENRVNQKSYLMNPIHIVTNSDLISAFDSTQAFYIGLRAGTKLIRMHQKETKSIHHGGQ